jgi:hypothetical protein
MCVPEDEMVSEAAIKVAPTPSSPSSVGDNGRS